MLTASPAPLFKCAGYVIPGAGAGGDPTITVPTASTVDRGSSAIGVGTVAGTTAGAAGKSLKGALAPFFLLDCDGPEVTPVQEAFDIRRSLLAKGWCSSTAAIALLASMILCRVPSFHSSRIASAANFSTLV